MKYLPITPVGLLPTIIDSGQQSAFILSQFWDIPEYRKFYTSHEWDTVIIDNDLYETTTPAPFNKMEQIANEISANTCFVVGPEDLSDGCKTANMTINILEDRDSDGFLFTNSFDTDVHLMTILHERPNEICQQWDMVMDYDQLGIGVSIFSYRLGYDRGSLAKHAGVKGTFYLHAFGWDNLLEATNLKDAGFDSVDSSIAVTSVINNIDLFNNWQITRNPGRDGVVASNRANITDVDFTPQQYNQTVWTICKIQLYLDHQE